MSLVRLACVVILAGCVLLSVAQRTGVQAQEEVDSPEVPTDTDPFPYRLGLRDSDSPGAPRVDLFASGRSPTEGAATGRVDLSPLYPPIGEQGDQASSVGWATAGVRTYYEIRDGRRSLADPPLSPSFIYNQCNAGADDGCSVADGLHILQAIGVVPVSDFPYLPDDFRRQPDPELLARAASFRVAGFGRLWAGAEQPNLNALRQSLALGDPVILGVRVAANDSWLQGPVVGVPDPTDAPIGNHAVVALGFDDERGLVRFANSWGAGWGDHGYGYLPYDYVDGGFAQEAWVMTLFPASGEPVTPTPGALSPVQEASTPVPPSAPRGTGPVALPPAVPEGPATPTPTRTSTMVPTPTRTSLPIASPSPTTTSTPVPPTPTPVPTQASSSVSVRIAAISAPMAGQTVDVQVLLSVGTGQASGMDLRVSFPPALLRLDSFTPSGVFDSVLVNGPPNNSAGTYRYVGVTRSNPDVTGNGVLVGTLRFTGLAAGSGQVIASPDVALNNPPRDVTVGPSSATITVGSVAP